MSLSCLVLRPLCARSWIPSAGELQLGAEIPKRYNTEHTADLPPGATKRFIWLHRMQPAAASQVMTAASPNWIQIQSEQHHSTTERARLLARELPSSSTASGPIVAGRSKQKLACSHEL